MFSSLIPNKTVKNNLQDSYRILSAEGLYTSQFGNSTAMWDNWTDSLILNIIANQSNTNILKSAIANNKTVNSSDNSTIFDLGLAVDLEQDDTEQVEDYSRYWVGIAAPLKLLLTVFDLQQIRYLIFIVFALMQGLLFIRINKKLNTAYTIAYMLSTTIVCSYYNVCSLAFSTDLLVMQIFMFIIIHRQTTAFWDKNRCFYYFMIGSFTFFINFLSAPLLTLGFPLILEMLLTNKENKIRQTVKAAAAWFGGYVITILIKQILAKLVLGRQSGLWQILHWSGLKMGEADNNTSIITRLFNGSSGLENQLRLSDRFAKVHLRSLDIINSTTGFILLIIIIAVVIMLLHKKIIFIRPDKQMVAIFIMIGLLPFLWLFIFAVHAGHGFDSINLSVFIFACLSLGASFIKIKNQG